MDAVFLQSDSRDESPLVQTVLNKAELTERLVRIGTTLAEYAILTQTAFSPRPMADVARHSRDPIYSFDIPVTLLQLEAALISCLERGWLFVVTQSWLQHIRATLDAGQVFGPVCRLPSVGEVDVTKSGIKVLSLCRAVVRSGERFDAAALAYLERHPFVVTNNLEWNELHRKERGYTFTRPNPEQVLSGYRDDGYVVLSASDPIPIERLCITWRDEPVEGFFMDVEIAIPN